jgi:LuxR family maltose regulon positive regulatory protein
MTEEVEGGAARPDVGPVLTVGLGRPAPTAGTLVRQDLVDRLDGGRRLSLVVAPAGYGKSTLLAQWADAVPASVPVAWVTLEPGDNDPLALWSRVVLALQQVCPDLDVEISMGWAGHESRLDLSLVRLVNSLDSRGPLGIVLDDLHRVTRTEARESLAWFVENAPRHVRIALGSRTQPSLRTGMLRARDELTQVRADLLRFSADEAEWLLNERFALGLGRSDVESLVARTEGWPAGLQLAAMSLATSADRRALVAAFGASHRYIQEFLMEEVLDGYSDELRSLMVRMSVMDRICGPLMDAVLERSGSADQLAELARTNLFLIPLDDAGTWYRFHHLFGQLLRAELDRSAPGLAPALHKRASLWFDVAGEPADAITHVLRAGNVASAAALIEANWVEFALQGRFETVQGWLDALPEELVRRDARLVMIQAWVFDLRGDHERAGVLGATVRRGEVLALGPQRDGFSCLEADSAMRRATFPNGDVGAQVADGRRVLELEGDGSPFLALATVMVGIGSLLSGDLDEAGRLLTRAHELGCESEHWVVAGSAAAYHSFMLPAQSEECHSLASTAHRIITDNGLQNMAGEASIALARASVAREPREVTLGLVRDGLAGLHAYGQPTELAYGLLQSAAICSDLGEPGPARDHATEAASLIAGFAGPGVMTRMLAELAIPWRDASSVSDDSLTESELRVLELLPGGGSERDIGDALFLSFNTIHTHVRGIYRKLGVTTRADAVARAHEIGLLVDDFT